MKFILLVLYLFLLTSCNFNIEDKNGTTIHFKSFQVENVEDFNESKIPYFGSSAIEGVYLDKNYTISYNDEKNINDIYVKLYFDDVYYQENDIINVIRTYSKVNEVDENTVKIKYYVGNYDDVDVAIVVCSKYDYLQAITTEEIAGISFTYYEYNKLIVIYNGEVFSLEDAYNDNIINKDELININNNYNKIINNIYD